MATLPTAAATARTTRPTSRTPSGSLASPASPTRAPRTPARTPASPTVHSMVHVQDADTQHARVAHQVREAHHAALGAHGSQ
eukprot:8815852-Alexandrium_andersonii.AAC.1